MNLENVIDLRDKSYNKVNNKLIIPQSHENRFGIGLGIRSVGKADYFLAIHLPSKRFKEHPVVEEICEDSKGEVYIEIVGPVSLYGLCIGTTISHSRYSSASGIRNVGTLGCFVKKRGKVETEPLILGCSHVMTPSNNEGIGDSIVCDRNIVAQVVDCTRPQDGIDAAIAAVKANIAIDTNTIKLRGQHSMSGLNTGLKLQKLGQSTGLTRGELGTFGLTEIIPYPTYQDFYIFKDLITIEGVGNQPFSQPGDSGSLIFSNEYAVALLLAGTSTGITYAQPFEKIAKRLKIELLL